MRPSTATGVYILGTAGTPSCFGTATGGPSWQVNTAADYGVTMPAYGVGHSWFVEDDPPGHAARQGVRRQDGGVREGDRGRGEARRGAARSAGDSEAGYAASTMTTAGGRAVVDRLAPAGVTSLDPATGRTWWQHDCPLASELPVHHAGGERRPDAGAQSRPPGGADGLDQRQPQPHRLPGAAIRDVDPRPGERRDLRAQQLRRVARRRHDSRRAAVVERAARVRGAPGQPHFVQHGDRAFVSVETQ